MVDGRRLRDRKEILVTSQRAVSATLGARGCAVRVRSHCRAENPTRASISSRSRAVLSDVALLREHAEQLSDASLLAGLAASDRAACVAFIGRFERAVYGLALSMLGDRELAQDVAQETFLRAWRHAHAYDPRRGALATWLLAITRNLAIDVLRLRRVELIDPQHPTSFGMLHTDCDPSDLAVHASDRQRVRAAVAQLPVEQRQALFFSVFRGCTAKEISELEQIPLGTAKTRIRAGLKKVRALLDNEGELSDSL